MKHTFKAAVAALVLAVGFAGSAAAGPREDAAREDAAAAYRKGDHATGLRLMRPLAEHGDVRAQVGLGLMYEFGYGDYGAATSWYRKAAEQGETSSQVKLGHMYSGGLGVPQDYATAESWFRKAANQGNAEGQSGLGDMYTTGSGVPQDYVIAHMWFNLAAARGHKESVKLRNKLAALMTPAQIAEAQKLAREWKPISP
jgi:uncharacterized protein